MSATVLVVGSVLWAKPEFEKLMAEKGAKCAYTEPGAKKADIIKTFKSYDNLKVIYHAAGHGSEGAVDQAFIDALPESCKTICHFGAGYDDVNVALCTAAGITVSHTPGSVDNATATTGVYLLLAAMRQFYKAETHCRAGNWKNGLPLARDPEDKVLGVVGMGGIGSLMAKRMHYGWNMKIIYYNRKPISPAPDFPCEYVSTLEEMLGKADVVSLNLPLNANTEKSFGAKQFGWMKKGSVIVNTARGGVIDEPALIAALKSGHLYGAGLDVFPNEPHINPELIALDNVSLLPHMGTETWDSRFKMEMQVINNCASALDGKGVINLVAEQQRK